MRQNSRLYKKKKLRGAPLRSKRRPLANRRAGIFLFKRAVSFLKSRAPLSKAGAVRNHEASDLSGCVITHHMRLGALRKPRAEPGFEPRFPKNQLFQFVVTRHLHRQLCENYGPLCQKARNGYCSSIHRLPTEVRWCKIYKHTN